MGVDYSADCGKLRTGGIMGKLLYVLPLLVALMSAGCGKQESDLPVNTRLGGDFTLPGYLPGGACPSGPSLSPSGRGRGS